MAEEQSVGLGWSDQNLYSNEATPKSVLKLMGLKGLTLYHLKSHLQKYRLGQQSKKQNTTSAQVKTDSNITRNNYSCSRYSLHCSEASTSGNSSPSPNANYELGDVAISEALRCQLQIQNNLQPQLEVQQRLQTRIEAQGKYLQAILCKAQEDINISFDNSCKNNTSSNNSNQERILFSGLHVTDKEIKSVFDQIYPDDHAHRHPQGSRQDHDDINGGLLKIKHEAAPASDYCSLQLNLNNATNYPTPSSYDFGGAHAAELQAKLLACRR